MKPGGADEFGNEMGETLIPGLENMATMIHEARYRWAAKDIRGRVLDVGCGIGYGSKILLEKCDEYIGFDKYLCRKQRADRDYADDRATFLVHSANVSFPFESKSFNTIICFEAIEHIQNHYKAMAEIARVLKSGGVFFCSTPINEGQPIGHYHIREYTVDQFKDLIETQFTDVRYYGQSYNTEFIENEFKDYIYICCMAIKRKR